MSSLQKIPYDDLFHLWRQWLEQRDWMPLDKWLRNQLRKNNKVPAPFSSSNAQLGLHMFSAMRYCQLACALEETYKTGIYFDLRTWDSTWSLASVKKIPVAAFWYWIVLREGQDATGPKALRDIKERNHWFAQFKAQLAETDDEFARLLWAGLRPGWLDLLQERKEKSQWTQDQLIEFIARQNTFPPLWLRVQKNKSLTEIVSSLQQEGVHVELNSDGHLCAHGGVHLSSTQAYKEGWVEIQDLASQQIAQAVEAKPGQKVWDACAGAGGKSLAIAVPMNNKGVLVATDLHSYKLEELKRRCKRAEIFNLRSFEWSGEAPLRLPKEIAQQQGFDWVLIDAPCSSSGTWRRNPDARWRFDAEDSEELIRLQRQIMTNAAPAVRLKGKLVYATCSWQCSENEGQIEWFLKNNPNFILQTQTMLGAPQQNSDTMFVAVLERIL